MLNIVYIDDGNVARFSSDSLAVAPSVRSDVCMDDGRGEGNVGDGEAVLAIQDMGGAGKEAIVASGIQGVVGSVRGFLEREYVDI